MKQAIRFVFPQRATPSSRLLLAYQYRVFSSQPKKLVEQQQQIPKNDEKQAFKSYNQKRQIVKIYQMHKFVQMNLGKIQHFNYEDNPLSTFWNLKVDIYKKEQTIPQDKISEETKSEPLKRESKKEKKSPAVKPHQDIPIPESCSGCGVKFQHEDSKQIGYLPKAKVIQHQKRLNELEQFQQSQPLQDLSDSDKNLIDYLRQQNAPSDVILELQRSQHDPHRNSPEILDVQTLLELDRMQGKTGKKVLPKVESLSKVNEYAKFKKEVDQKPNNLICQRCHELKHLHQRMDYQNPVETGPGQPTLMAAAVNRNDRETILKTLTDKMYSKSIVIKVIDMANFEGSQIDEIYETVNIRKHKLIIVCNKIDSLPKGLRVDRLQTWVKNQIKDKIKEGIKYHICLASAKETTGIQKVLDILEQTKKEYDEKEFLPKVQIITPLGPNQLLSAPQNQQLVNSHPARCP